ncbi:MAG: hypothetical protein U0T74_07105 [Chitinophagales bacterium]
MKISLLPPDFKVTSPFSRPVHIRADTHHLCTVGKYVVEIVFHSAMFYAPEFYKVSVKNTDGQQVWSGGDAMFLDSLFRTDFVSDKYDRMILTRVNSTDSSNHMQIILIDLNNGKEEVLTEEGAYHSVGHFVSFDCIYYSDYKGVHCIDYSNQNRFMLHDVLLQHFSDIKTWGACGVEDCILVVTHEPENNLYLFNLVKNEIVDSTTFHWKTADYVGLTIGYVMEHKSTNITVVYSDRQASGALKFRQSEHFLLEF